MPYQRNQTQTPEAAKRANASTSRQPPSPAYDSGPSLLQLHAMIGNRAMGRILQAKLKVNEPGDEYEREADAVAEMLMRMPEPSAPRIADRSLAHLHAPAYMQRKCAECASGKGLCPKCAEEEEMAQRKPLTSRIIPIVQRQVVVPEKEEEEEILQTKRIPGPFPEVSPDVQAHINAMRGGGQPLSPSIRVYFESRFGYDFSQVRVHTDSKARESAQALNARAYTVGRDVVLGTGQYAPETMEGRRLLAHELTHVVQQANGTATGRTQTPNNQVISNGTSLTPNRSIAVASSGQNGMVQREGLGIGDIVQAAIDPKSLLGKVWLGLDRKAKASLIDKAIDAALKLVEEFPGKALLGEMWIFVKEGLIGFYGKLKSAAEEIKIRVIDKIATIMAGQSQEYTLGLLKGLVKGFFIDGALGIFIAIWDLIKGLKSLWNFIKGIGEAIAGFPEDIQRLIQGFQNLGEELAANFGSAIEEVKKLVTDPKEGGSFLTTIVEKGKAFAKQGGEKIADSLLDFFSKPGAEAEIGETTGNVIGQVLWEVVFAIVTAGGGAAVTAAKETIKGAVTVLGKIVGKIAGAVLKVVEEIRLVFGKVVELVKGAVKFVKGKLAEVGGRFGKLLDDIGEFFAKLLQNCHEKSPIVCDLAQKIVKAHEVVWKGFVKGKLADHFTKHGAEFGAKNASDYLKKAKDFGAKAGPGVREHTAGNTIFKYEEATNSLFIGNAGGRHIKTFYKPTNGLAGYFEAIRKHLDVLRELD